MVIASDIKTRICSLFDVLEDEGGRRAAVAAQPGCGGGEDALYLGRDRDSSGGKDGDGATLASLTKINRPPSPR